MSCLSSHRFCRRVFSAWVLAEEGLCKPKGGTFGAYDQSCFSAEPVMVLWISAAKVVYLIDMQPA